MTSALDLPLQSPTLNAIAITEALLPLQRHAVRFPSVKVDCTALNSALDHELLCSGGARDWGREKKGRVEVMAEKIHKHTMERTQQQLSSLQSDWRGAGLGLHSWDGDGWCWFQRWGQVVGVETAQQVVEKNTDACHQPPEQGAIWVHFSHRG